ncbi:MAG: hypothetical protein Q8K55_11155 [Gemmatimonadaceae bacterium]|nr:hypothetical protein [Gemmatimonadaceae bacterium]
MLVRPIALVLFLALAAAPADAQLGGLAKKMKEKAVQAAAEKAGLDTKNAPTPPTYDDVILELTAPRVDALIKGLGASQAVLTANGGIPAILKEREALEAQISTLNDRANAVSSGYYNARDRWSSCEDDAQDALSKTHEDDVRKAMAAMIANPAVAAERGRNASAYQQEMAKAIASGDSVALKKVTTDYYKIWGIDLSKDEAVIARKCGAVPPKPQAMIDLDRANARKDSLDVKARAIETRAVLEGSKVSGLTEQQFAMARERAQMAVTGTRTRFSRGELAVLDARKSELLAYLKP